jgi:acyl-CoA synthetase (AMP-forming)/AMP-acid ligase II
MTFTYDPSAYRTYFEHEFTYLAGFRRNVHRYARRTAMTDPGTDTSWTYAQLGARVDALAAGPARAGVGPGDVVLHQQFNSPEFAQLHLATQACAAVGAPVNFRLAAGETAHVLDDSEPTVVVYDTALGDTVADALVNSPQQEAEKFHDGWIHVGDLATWDADEYVTIVGRKDDMLISGGENVHPVQVEEALDAHAGVADSLVVGLPDERWGQRVVAYVVREDSTLTAADLETHCRGHAMLAADKRPWAYRFVDGLPLTATGKKIHYMARAQAAEDDAAGLFEAVRTDR